MILAWDNKVDSATVTAGSEIATLPASNVKTAHLSQKWHTAAGVKASSLLIDAGSVIAFSMLAVLGTNLTPSARMRLRASATDPNATASVRVDTGVVNGGVKTGYGAIYKHVRQTYTSVSGVPEPSLYCPLTVDIVPRLGSGSPTFTRATTAYVEDFEGLLKPVLSGEARFKGARRVHNTIVGSSSDFTNVNWTNTNVTVTAGVADPVAGMSATTLTAAAGGATIYNNSAQASGTKVLNSVWVRRRTGAGTVQMWNGGDNTKTDITAILSTSWQRISLGVQTAAGASNNALGFDLATNGDAIDVYAPQREIVTGQTNQNPSEYVSVGVLSAPFHGAGVDGVKYFAHKNGNTVSGNVVTEAQGAAIGASDYHADALGPYGYLAEGARTNLALQSQAFDNAAWNPETGIVVTANDAVAPDGTTTADKIADNTNNSAHRIYQTSNISFTLNTSYTVSCRVKRGDHRWVQLRGGSPNTTFAAFDLLNGVVGSKAASVSSSRIASLPNGCYLIEMTYTANATAADTAGLWFSNADSATEVAYIGTGTYIWAWGFQIEAGGFASTYIPTTTASVTRNADELTYQESGNFSDTAGAVYAEFIGSSLAPFDSANGILVGNGGATPLFYVASNNVAATWDGTSQLDSSVSTTLGARVKAASSWGNSARSITANGAAVQAGAYDGAFEGMSNIQIASAGGGQQFFGTVRNVRIWQSKLTDAQLKALTDGVSQISVEYEPKARYFLLELEDAAVSSNLQVGRIFLGPSWSHAQTLVYGWGVTPVDPSPIEKSRGGQSFPDTLAKYRVLEFTLDFLTEAEIYTNAFALARANGRVKDVLAIPSESSAYISEQSVWGLCDAFDPVVQRMGTIYRQKFRIEERL